MSNIISELETKGGLLIRFQVMILFANVRKSSQLRIYTVDCICCYIHSDETNHSNHIHQKGRNNK